MGQSPSAADGDTHMKPASTDSGGDGKASAGPAGGRSAAVPAKHARSREDEMLNDLTASASSPPSRLTERVKKQLFEEQAEAKQRPPALPQPAPQMVETVPTTFKWTHGGNSVFVTGSFNNWQGKIPMMRSEDGKDFVLQIDILPGVHQYKYIVDETWRLDADMPTTVNQGAVNNMIEVKRPVFEDTRAELSAALVDSDDELDENKQKISYGQRVPAADDYVKDPLKLPPQLTQVLLAQQTQTSVDNNTLPLPQSHVTLNHLYVYSGASTDASVLVTGITQRFKLKAFASLTAKFVTTVYYSPKPGT